MANGDIVAVDAVAFVKTVLLFAVCNPVKEMALFIWEAAMEIAVLDAAVTRPNWSNVNDGTLADDDGTLPPAPIDVRAIEQEPDVQDTLVEAFTLMPEPGAIAVIVPPPPPPKQFAADPLGITFPLLS